jgi:tetratricopeptide (TPR) repeat protein
LREKGELPSAQMRMFLDGQWRDVLSFGLEITDEPIGPTHSPQVDDWGYQALQLLKQGDGKGAEALLKQSLDVEPDCPDLLNNLTKAYELQGRTEEAEQLTRTIHSRWPDYFFGRIGMATICMRAEEYAEAEAYLVPLRERTRLHQSEYSALCHAYVMLYVGQRDFDAAKNWLKTWKEVQPDHPALAKLESTVTLCSAFGKLSGKFGKPRRR